MANKQIRIAVIIDHAGRWAAQSAHNIPDNEVDWPFLEECLDADNLVNGTRRFFVVADVPIPEGAIIAEIPASAVIEEQT